MRPAWVGVAPRASCMYWLRKTDAPNIAIPVAMDATTASVKVRFLNSVSGISGFLTRSSVMMNRIVARIAPPTMRIVWVLHQSNESPASVTQMSRSETADESRTMPK